MPFYEEAVALGGEKRIEGVVWRKLALDMLCERPVWCKNLVWLKSQCSLPKLGLRWGNVREGLPLYGQRDNAQEFIAC